MSHIFVAYSRYNLDFASKIIDALAESHLDTWVDWKSIPKGEQFQAEIYRGIEEANVFLYLLSPDAVQSYFCTEELEHAAKNGKRILPIVIVDTDASVIHPEISKRNWIFCRDGKDSFDQALEEIRETIHTDYDWLVYHTKLQVKALDWGQTNDSSRLLRGRELRESEERFAIIGDHVDPQPTKLQREYILASQISEDRDRRRITFSLGFGLLIVTCLAMFSWMQRNAAIGLAQQVNDLSNQLTQISQPTRSPTLEIAPTPQPTASTSGKSESMLKFTTILAWVAGSILTTGGVIILNIRNRNKIFRDAEITEPKIKLNIFLCHSSKDKPKVKQYYERLKAEKWIVPWLDVEQLLPGMDWDKEIKSAVKSSNVVLVFLSKFSIGKEGYVQKEIKQALDVADEKPYGTIFIIPLRLEDCEVPDRLTQWQWLNLYEDDSYGKLIKALKVRANDLTAKNIGVK